MKQLPTPRDILLYEVDNGILITAVDSCGGIGFEPHDALRVDPETAGMFTARVALLEITAVGAKPMFAALAVSSGPKTAEPLITGVRKMLGESFPLAISTEKNMPTSMTGFGVTVTGICPAGNLKAAGAKNGDLLFCAGLPLVGKETVKTGACLFNTAHADMLLKNKHVHALIPVGSRGIAAEAEVLAGESGLMAKLNPPADIDLYKSGGPSSCAVFAADTLTGFDINLPIFRIGKLYYSNYG